MIDSIGMEELSLRIRVDHLASADVEVRNEAIPN